MGDPAEAAFSRAQILGKYVRLGWNRPDVSMKFMPPRLRALPDYYVSSGQLVEVMGCGRDLVLKLKIEKYEGLKFWNQAAPLSLFIFNSHLKQWALVSWAGLKKLIAKARRDGIKAFDDGNEYYPIQWAWLEDAGAHIGADHG